MSILRFILSGLWLPFRLYLQPYQFHQEIAELAPDLPWFYSLWQARRHLRRAEFRHALYRLGVQGAIALCWVPLCLGVVEALGYPVDWMRVAAGVATGVATGVAVGVAYGVTAVVTAVVAVGVAVGVATGVAYGVATGVATGVADVLTVIHFPTLILQLPASLLSWPIHRLWPRSSRWLWRIHPVRWDEIILLPLPGLPGLLATLYRLDSTAGRLALAETAAHRYQYRAAYRAWAMLAQEQAHGIASSPGLAQFPTSLDWLNEDTPLPESLRGLLLSLRDISREAASALESDSATNQLRRLEAARAALETLGKQHTGEFGPAVRKWTGLVDSGLADARRRQRQEEPIPQIYHGDGRPLRPDGRADGETPFKGRRALFRRLEEALGGAEGGVRLICWSASGAAARLRRCCNWSGGWAPKSCRPSSTCKARSWAARRMRPGCCTAWPTRWLMRRGGAAWFCRI